MTQYIVYTVISYLVGSIPIGLILSKIKGKDPRMVGSGNIGATNVMRTAGKALGIITLIGDAAKGFIPVSIALFTGQQESLIAVVGLATFIGHLYPLYLRFKGGKGVATALGVYIAVSPLSVLISIIVFVLALVKWRYVSLGSLIGTGVMPISLMIFKLPNEYILLSLIIGFFIFIRHKDNIKRLLKGEENRFKK